MIRASAQLRKATRSAKTNEPASPSKLPTPPAEMVEFVKNLIRDDDRARPRKNVARPPLVFEAVTIPLDDKLQPSGEPFVTLARNVSLARASLVHSEPIQASFLRISLEVVNLGATMVAKVRRSHAKQPYFEVDCEFVARAA